MVLVLCGCSHAVPVPPPPVAPPLYPYVAMAVWTGSTWGVMLCTPDPVLHDGVTYDCQ